MLNIEHKKDGEISLKVTQSDLNFFWKNIDLYLEVTSLDLSRNQLTSLPAQIGDLKSIT